MSAKERPSSYFYNCEKSKSSSKVVNSIAHNDVTYTDSEGILNCFKDFYTDLYSEEKVDNSINDTFFK